jgi:PAS domain S-box-containing protein/putative nucleotidyltransferase with HDIG domain
MLDLEYGEQVYSFYVAPIIAAGYANLYGRDITERKQAEEALRESEELFRSAFESSVAGISMVAADGKFIEVNDKLCELLGRGRKELIQLSFSDITYEEDIEVGSKYLKQMIAGELENVSFEKRYIKKGGNVIWVFLSISAIRDKQKKLQYFVTYTQDITERIAAAEKLQSSLVGTVNTVAMILEARDPYTSGHQKRVAEISVAIAKELGLPEEQIQGIYFSSLIHDLGKIQVPAEILSKPGKLTRLEFDMIKTHSKVGYELLKEIEFPWPIAEIVYQHHERVNGSGYPRKLKGNRISIEAKIIGTADVIEAMSSHRPYRPALGLEAALDEINKNKGILFDPDIVVACIKVIKKDKTLLPST